MAAPTTFRGRLMASYVGTANAIAAESVGTTDHVKRLAIARQFAAGGGIVDQFVTIDMTLCAGQYYDDSTIQSTIDSRLSALLPNLVALGFGG